MPARRAEICHRAPGAVGLTAGVASPAVALRRKRIVASASRPATRRPNSPQWQGRSPLRRRARASRRRSPEPQGLRHRNPPPQGRPRAGRRQPWSSSTRLRLAKPRTNRRRPLRVHPPSPRPRRHRRSLHRKPRPAGRRSRSYTRGRAPSPPTRRRPDTAWCSLSHEFATRGVLRVGDLHAQREPRRGTERAVPSLFTCRS